MAHISLISSSFCKSEALRRYATEQLADHLLQFADGQPLRDLDLLKYLNNAEAAVIGREIIDDALLASCPRLRILSLYGVGYDNVDVAACTRRNVKLLVKSGVNAKSVAEHTIGLMLATLRNIAYTDRLLHRGIWHKDGGRQLTGSTVAVIGCGHVGSEVARLLKAFNCKILLNDIRDISQFANEIGAFSVDFKTCVESADIITIHVPLTSKTNGLFNAEIFAQMQSHSILINTSRGGVVRQKDLTSALLNGNLGGAALDVFESEPLADPEIYCVDRLVTTPHIAGNSKEAIEAMGRAAVDMLRNCLNRIEP